MPPRMLHLLLVPVIYSIFVLDLKLVRWNEPPAAQIPPAEKAAAATAADQPKVARAGSA